MSFLESLRHYSVLNIVIDETRVFSTKERAPYYVCLEIFMPQEYLPLEFLELISNPRELAYEYNEYFGITTQKKKDNSKSAPKNLVNRAKTMQHISHEGMKLENQFKIGSVNEIVSIPMTLKVNFFNDKVLINNIFKE